MGKLDDDTTFMTGGLIVGRFIYAGINAVWKWRAIGLIRAAANRSGRKVVDVASPADANFLLTDCFSARRRFDRIRGRMGHLIEMSTGEPADEQTVALHLGGIRDASVPSPVVGRVSFSAGARITAAAA